MESLSMRRGHPLQRRIATALLLVVAATHLLQGQPVALAVGPSSRTSKGPARHSAGSPGVIPPLFKSNPFKGSSLLDALKHLRLERGDVTGAARVDTLRKWFSILGLYRGLLPLSMDLFKNRGLAADIAKDWTTMVERLAVKPVRGAGLAPLRPGSATSTGQLPELLAANPAEVLNWVRATATKAQKAFKGSAVSRLLADLYHELSADPFFITDLIKAAQLVGWEISATATLHVGSGSGSGGSWLPEELTSLAQQVLDVLREELFPDATPHRSGGGSKPSRQGPIPGKGLGGRGTEL
ncbi:hypothetical protein VaNZ11_003873 [Volvox africanus]|uniref:Uncharacterized protein n=1 Tax=Volvox africanus TaxID=51714 RepID=A0ABQ5RWM9_9CHLO|nr:hypothetical protein VaNZ11_003873 [Volvox africanus]